MGCGTIVEIAGAALALGGAGTEMYANNQVRNKMNNLTGQELTRQKQYQNQASDVFNQSLSKSTPQAANQQIGQGQQQLAQLINQVQGVPLSASMPSFGDVNSSSQQAKQGMSNTAASNLGGYSNYSLQQRLKDIAAQSQLGVISGNARQSSNVLPYELQQAQNSEQGLQSAGSIMSDVGMLAGLGGMGMGMSAAAPATSGLDYWGAAPAGSYGNMWQNGKWMAFQ